MCMPASELAVIGVGLVRSDPVIEVELLCPDPVLEVEGVP